MANRRFWRDLKFAACSSELKSCGIRIEENDSFHMNVFINGPEGTPYENGEFIVAVDASSAYPFEAPQAKFLTKIWHPNISSNTGTVCLDVLSTKWRASMTIETVCLSIQNLLINPEPSDPMDAVVGSQMSRDMDLFLKTARHLTSLYAGGASPVAEFTQAQEYLGDLGFTDNEIIRALTQSDWNVERAADLLY